MEKHRSFSQSVLLVVLATAMFLMVPYVAMMFTSEVNWTPTDFIAAGIVIFSTGLAFVVLMRYANDLITKAAMIMALGTTFLMIWANMAVGLIGSGPNLANLLYALVVAVGVIGAILSHFAPRGMERTMYAMAFGVVAIAIIAILSKMQVSIMEILGVNTAFAVIFGVAGILFRFVGMGHSHGVEKSKG